MSQSGARLRGKRRNMIQLESLPPVFAEQQEQLLICMVFMCTDALWAKLILDVNRCNLSDLNSIYALKPAVSMSLSLSYELLSFLFMKMSQMPLKFITFKPILISKEKKARQFIVFQMQFFSFTHSWGIRMEESMYWRAVIPETDFFSWSLSCKV